MENEEKVTKEVEKKEEFGGTFHERDTVAENNIFPTLSYAIS